MNPAAATTSGRWQRIRELFEAALERNAAERATLIDQVCGNDLDLRREVEALLAADAKVNESEFLEEPAVNVAEAQGAGVPTMTSSPIAESGIANPDEHLRIGPYQILKELGHGGMGTVYLAERADGQYRKQVAIKLVSPQVATQDILKRFRNERQVQAAFEHPNIARLLDGEVTPDGRPYLVMEYVQGVRIDTWCDMRNASIRDRLILFRQVCSAVQYAHEKQVIHRDLKPGNILVTSDGTPKLLDFGIAKVLNPELSDSAETTLGPGPMTPEYASPEQVRGERVGPASDIYALGVVLYYLLTGRLPYLIQGTDLQKIARIICEQEPEKPSAAIQREPQSVRQATGEAVASRETLSRVRNESPTSLRRILTGDLDNVVLKALRKEPERRYQSVAEFSDDLDRFLRDLPVSAHRESLTYIGRKFLKRNRTPVLVAALSAALGVALVTGLHQFHRTGYEFTPDQSSIAVLPLVNVNGGPDQYFADGLSDELLNKMVTIPGLRVAGNASTAQFKNKAEDIRVVGRKLNVAAILEGTARRQGSRASITIRLINSADGLSLWSGTYDRELSDMYAVEQEIAREVTRSLKIEVKDKLAASPRKTNTEAYNAYLQGQYFLRRNKEMLEKAIGFFEQAIRLDSGYAPAWQGLGDARISQAESGLVPVDEGFRKAREAIERALVLDPNLAQAHLSLGIIKMSYLWDWAGAEASYQRALALAPGHPRAIRAAGSLAGVLGHWDDSIALYHRAIEIDPMNAPSYHNLGMYLHYAGQQGEAAEALKRSMEIAPANLGAHGMLCRVYLAQARLKEALAEAEIEQHPALRLHALALAYHALGQKKQSAASLDQLIAKYQADAYYQIADVFAFRGEPDRAFEWLDKAYSARDSGLTDIKGDPLLKTLTPDPRYRELLRKMHLPL